MPEEAFRVTGVPAHTAAVGDATAVTVGKATLVSCTVAVRIQPKLVPDTVYTVVAVGVTTVVASWPPCGAQVYVVEPPAVKVAEEPAQTNVEDAEAVTGTVLTVTARFAEAVPQAFVPATV